MNEEALISKINTLLQGARLRPEAQIATFEKYKTALDIGRDQQQAVVSLANSLGVQLRNDIQYSNASKSKNAQQVAPVFSLDHLANFEDFSGLKSKLKELPSEWTVIQLSKELCVHDILGMTQEHRRPDPTLLVTRFACGDQVERVPPYLVRIPPHDNPLTGPNMLDRMKEMIKLRRDASNDPQKRIQAMVKNLDVQLVSLVNEVESYWLREWRYILGGRLVDRSLEDEIRKEIDEIIGSVSNLACKCKSKAADILFHLVTNAHTVKDTDFAKCVFNALYDDLPSGQPIDDLCRCMLKICLDHIKALNSKHFSSVQKRHPVILITEPSLELFPWEMTCSLSGQPVSRILSLHFLYALFKYHEANIHNGYRHVSVSSGFCLLNPEKNLDDCEKQMGSFLKKELAWMDVISGVLPDPDEIVANLSQHSLYLYCGHGSGAQYFKKGALRKALVDALVLLYGCSSNLPQSRGGRTPYQNDNTYTYLTNGCPCTVGALFVVSSSEVDRASMKMLSSMLPTVSQDGGPTVKSPVQPDVLRALQLGKSACHQFWTKSCLVARGIPVKIVFSKEEKTRIISKLKEKR